jgi:hypothetical protein
MPTRFCLHPATMWLHSGISRWRGLGDWATPRPNQRDFFVALRQLAAKTKNVPPPVAGVVSVTSSRRRFFFHADQQNIVRSQSNNSVSFMAGRDG